MWSMRGPRPENNKKPPSGFLRRAAVIYLILIYKMWVSGIRQIPAKVAISASWS